MIGRGTIVTTLCDYEAQRVICVFFVAHTGALTVLTLDATMLRPMPVLDFCSLMSCSSGSAGGGPRAPIDRLDMAEGLRICCGPHGGQAGVREAQITA